MGDGLPLKQSLLRILISALVLSALIGIYAFLFGDFGETEIKILLTTLTVSYFSVTSLACAAAFEKRRSALLSAPGLALGVVGFLLFVPGIWAEWIESEPYAKAMAVIGIFSFSFAQACLLSLPELERRFRWVFHAALVAIFALASLISGMLLLEVEDEWLVRLLGVIGILDGCATVLIPVLYKLGANGAGRFVAGPYRSLELRCPRCDHRSIVPAGKTACAKCSLSFGIEIHEPAGEEAPTAGD